MVEVRRKPAFYAAEWSGPWRDYWLLLHPPYTAWHLSYVVLGASLAPTLDLRRLAATLVAFGMAVGVSAHALDELHDRPLGTRIPAPVLGGAAAVGLTVALVLGAAGILWVGLGLLPFIVVGTGLLLAYNLELFGGFVHTDSGFALSWGAFPVVTAYFAQTGHLSLSSIVTAAGAFGLSRAQRHLSTPARTIRRRVGNVSGSIVFLDRSIQPLDEQVLLRPLENALRALSWAVVALAAGAALAHLG